MNRKDVRYEQGKTFLAEGNYQEAALIFEQISKEMPKFKKAWEKLSIAYVNLDKIDEAVQCYDEILIRYPKDSFALYQKSILEEKAGHPDRALESVNKALKAEPENAEYLYLKGFILFRKKKFNDAIFWFDRSLEFDPFYFQAADYKCICLMTLGVYDELILSASDYIAQFQELVHDLKQTEDAVDDLPEHSHGLFGNEPSKIMKEDIWRLYSYLSFSYMKFGAFRQAERVLLQELEFDYEKSRVYFYLGLVQNALGQYEKAASSYELSLADDPNFIAARINLGLMFSKIAEEEPKGLGPASLSEKAIEFYQKSLSVLEQALSTEPENLTILYEIGKIYLILGDSKKAESIFNDILHLDASFIPVYEHLAKIKYNEGDYESAISILSDAQVKDPFNYEIMNLTGVIYSKKGDNEFALKCFVRAEMLDPANPKAYYNKALVFLKEEDHENVAASLSKITELNAVENGLPYEKILNYYGSALQKIGKKEEALSVFEKLQTLKPDDREVFETILDLKNNLKI